MDSRVAGAVKLRPFSLGEGDINRKAKNAEIFLTGFTGFTGWAKSARWPLHAHFVSIGK
jgi:hypothetical protein